MFKILKVDRSILDDIESTLTNYEFIKDDIEFEIKHYNNDWSVSIEIHRPKQTQRVESLRTFLNDDNREKFEYNFTNHWEIQCKKVGDLKRALNYLVKKFEPWQNAFLRHKTALMLEQPLKKSNKTI